MDWNNPKKIIRPLGNQLGRQRAPEDSVRILVEAARGWQYRLHRKHKMGNFKKVRRTSRDSISGVKRHSVAFVDMILHYGEFGWCEGLKVLMPNGEQARNLVGRNITTNLRGVAIKTKYCVAKREELFFFSHPSLLIGSFLLADTVHLI